MKENKQKYKRTGRHYCAERKCNECPAKGCYDCCKDEIAKEAARLVVLPCNMGDTLFVADKYKGKIQERTVERFTVGKSGYMEIWVGTTISVNAKQLGKTAFFTREEAEVALGGGEGDI